MNYPIFTDEELDDLNMSLFEVSESGTKTPQDFYLGIYEVLKPFGISIQPPNEILLPPCGFEKYDPAAKRGDDYIYLYISYDMSPDGDVFASHAELVDIDVLSVILDPA